MPNKRNVIAESVDCLAKIKIDSMEIACIKKKTSPLPYIFVEAV